MTTTTLATPLEEFSPTSSEISYSNNNYTYPEFAGFAGERQLKSILRKILSAAHYRLWELLTDYQAQGNDCYLSKRSIASGLDRGDRAISLCLEQLQARHLLTLRAERKLHRQPNGSYKPQMVIVKDFSGLYDLAHEYYLWMKEDPAYIAPDRDFADFLCQDEALVKKLRRFYDYRRVICDKYPGPKPKKQRVSEEDCWFADYAAPEPKSNAEAVLADQSTRIQQFNSPFNTQSNVQNNSLERINSTDNSQQQIERYSNDSGRDSEEGAAKDYTKDETPEPEQVRETLPPSPPPTKTTNPEEPSVSETGGVAQAESSQGQRRKKYQGDGKPRPVANAPISAYVRRFSPVLGDGNAHASETYLLRQAEEYGLSHPFHALACLVRAHVAAMPLEARHRDPITNKPLKMVTVNYLFKQFALSFSEWSHAYLANDAVLLIEDIQKDELLKEFVLNYRAQEVEDPEASSASQVVQAQDPAEPQLVFEELSIPPPAQWMDLAKAEALVARVEGDRSLLEAEKITLDFALIHRCRSLVHKGLVFVVELQLSEERAGQCNRWPVYLADAIQWQHYCEQQKILPRSSQP